MDTFPLWVGTVLSTFSLIFHIPLYLECCCTLRYFLIFVLSSFFFFLNIGFFFFLIYLYIYFWLCWVFVSVRGLSLVAASGGHSSSRCAGLSLSRPLLLRSTSSRRAGSVVVAHGPSRSAACGIFPPRHVGSSQTRAQTRVPCIGRQILNHCATREAPF